MYFFQLPRLFSFSLRRDFVYHGDFFACLAMAIVTFSRSSMDIINQLYSMLEPTFLSSDWHESEPGKALSFANSFSLSG